MNIPGTGGAVGTPEHRRSAGSRSAAMYLIGIMLLRESDEDDHERAASPGSGLWHGPLLASKGEYLKPCYSGRVRESGNTTLKTILKRTLAGSPGPSVPPPSTAANRAPVTQEIKRSGMRWRIHRQQIITTAGRNNRSRSNWPGYPAASLVRPPNEKCDIKAMAVAA